MRSSLPPSSGIRRIRSRPSSVSPFSRTVIPKALTPKTPTPICLSLTRKLAARELYVGEFYYKWEKYNASIFRLEYFLEKYPEATGRDKALYLLAQD